MREGPFQAFAAHTANAPPIPTHGVTRRRVRRPFPSSAFDQARIGQPLEHPREHGLMRFQIDQAT
jgi:hypothetical protein